MEAFIVGIWLTSRLFSCAKALHADGQSNLDVRLGWFNYCLGGSYFCFPARTTLLADLSCPPVFPESIAKGFFR